MCFCNIFLTNPSSDGDENFHPCTGLDEYRQWKIIPSIDFSVSWKDHWTMCVQIPYLILFVTVDAQDPNFSKSNWLNDFFIFLFFFCFHVYSLTDVKWLVIFLDSYIQLVIFQTPHSLIYPFKVHSYPPPSQPLHLVEQVDLITT